MIERSPNNLWNLKGRVLVFVLAATSIACLLLDFYAVCPMRTFTSWVFFPSILALFVLAAIDWRKGNRHLARCILIGGVCGLLAAVAYDVFRLPFVFAKQWNIDSVVPPLNLFKVFPRFGAMILGQAIEQSHYSGAARVIGWAYHFSNGLTFGVMYMALVGDTDRRSWWWGVVMAAGIEAAMLLTPYPARFAIPVTALFVVVTLTAHLIFGAAMGLSARWMNRNWKCGSSVV